MSEIIEPVLSELKQAKEQARYLLERYPASRNNDFYLQWLWLKHFGGVKDLPFIDYAIIQSLSGKLESVRRVRQKIQNDEGLFLPTDPAVLRRRQEKAQKYRQTIHKI